MGTPIPKPAEIFARDVEWSELTGFVASPAARASLAVVYGRRRQGKSFLLQHLCEQLGGFYFVADEGTQADSLRQLADAYAAHRHLPPIRFDTWHQVLDALLDLGADRPMPVVLDELPYLAAAAPALPSIIQAALDTARTKHPTSRTRLILCGSALTFMTKVLTGNAPLYGRSALDLIIKPLHFRDAAAFWQAGDPRLAALISGVAGGTPAYRRQFVDDDVPADLADFDDWVCRTALNPANPLFRESRYLLGAEPDLRDRALYRSILAAVATGNHTRGGIAGFIGRAATDISRPLEVLQDCGLLKAEADAFRANKSSYRITEPLVAFDHAIIRPHRALLERRQAQRVWQHARATFVSQVMGPHFEELCREWVAEFASVDTFGGLPIEVASATVADRHQRTSHQLDVVVHGAVGEDSRVLLSLGEAKWGKTMGMDDLARLRRILALLPPRIDTSHARLACYSGAGFTPELHVAARHGQVVLIDLERLYSGD